MSDYILQIKVKNGPLLRAMRCAGITSAAELARRAKVTPSIVGDYLNLKAPAINKNGDYYTSVLKICDVLRKMPTDIFPVQHLYLSLEKSSSEVEVSLDDIQNISSSEQADRSEFDPDLILRLHGFIDELPPRHRSVIEGRLSNKTRAELASELNVSVAAIQNIEDRATKKLKSKMDKLKMDDNAKYLMSVSRGEQP